MQELEKILKEIKDKLKDIYLDIANNYNISDLQYDGDKVACVASKFRCDAGRRIEKIIRKYMDDGWISVEEKVPDSGIYIFLSFTNFTLPMIGRYKKDSDGGAFYIGDEEETCVSQDLYVNAWRPLPGPYHPERR